jgi:hypothetical protein
VTSALWIGAATTLAGAALAGTIGLALNRQQMTEARKQRAEEDQRNRGRRSEERRFDAYANFATQARAYRDAIRALVDAPPSPALVERLDDLAQSANTASALVFLILESSATYDATRAAVMIIGRIQTALHSADTANSRLSWTDLNDKLAQLMREFQVAVRDELAVGGVDRSVFLDRTLETKRSYLASPDAQN